MTNEKFIMMAKLEVKRYTYDNVAKDGTSLFHVYVVWQAKVLQNHKALLATDIEDDQHYYEATYNGDKKQLYLYIYNKQENKSFEVEN